jgi:hypothetical protein
MRVSQLLWTVAIGTLLSSAGDLGVKERVPLQEFSFLMPALCWLLESSDVQVVSPAVQRFDCCPVHKQMIILVGW